MITPTKQAMTDEAVAAYAGSTRWRVLEEGAMPSLELVYLSCRWSGTLEVSSSSGQLGGGRCICR